jgi:hypothetical protein
MYETEETDIERDAKMLAELIYDIYTENKFKFPESNE